MIKIKARKDTSFYRLHIHTKISGRIHNTRKNNQAIKSLSGKAAYPKYVPKVHILNWSRFPWVSNLVHSHSYEIKDSIVSEKVRFQEFRQGFQNSDILAHQSETSLAGSWYGQTVIFKKILCQNCLFVLLFKRTFLAQIE